MTCPHRTIVSARVIPDSPEERDLAMGVACAIATATRAPTGIHDPTGRLRAWLMHGFCVDCEGE